MPVATGTPAPCLAPGGLSVVGGLRIALMISGSVAFGAGLVSQGNLANEPAVERSPS